MKCLGSPHSCRMCLARFRMFPLDDPSSPMLYATPPSANSTSFLLIYTVNSTFPDTSSKSPGFVAFE